MNETIVIKKGLLFGELQWLCRILDEEQNFCYKSVLKVDDDFIYAANSVQVHVAANIFNMETGYYRLKRLFKTKVELEKLGEYSYPLVVEKIKEFKEMKFNDLGVYNCNHDLHLSRSYRQVCLNCDNCYDINHYENSVNNRYNVAVNNEKNAPLYIKIDNDHHAYIMPYIKGNK